MTLCVRITHSSPASLLLVSFFKDHKNVENSIVTSFNRNFAGRNDGNAKTHTFLASPEIVTAMALAGSLCFNPITDELKTYDAAMTRLGRMENGGLSVVSNSPSGKSIRLEPPRGVELPARGFDSGTDTYQPPAANTAVIIDPKSERIQVRKKKKRVCLSYLVSLLIVSSFLSFFVFSF